MALQPSIRVINGRVFGAYAAQAKNVAYGQGTVEDALDDLKVKTLTGTTLAQLATAVNKLSAIQRINCKIVVDCGSSIGQLVFTTHYFEYKHFNSYARTGTGANCYIYSLDLEPSTPLINYTIAGSTSITQLSTLVQSWTLYYNGDSIE